MSIFNLFFHHSVIIQLNCFNFFTNVLIFFSCVRSNLPNGITVHNLTFKALHCYHCFFFWLRHRSVRPFEQGRWLYLSCILSDNKNGYPIKAFLLLRPLVDGQQVTYVPSQVMSITTTFRKD